MSIQAVAWAISQDLPGTAKNGIICMRIETARPRHAGLFRASEGRCFYCGVPVVNGSAKMDRDWLITDPGKRFIREHKIPVSRGGTSDPANYVASCFKCNQDKGSFTLSEFRFICGLRRGTMSFAFPFESKPLVRRDWLCVHSATFERSLVLRNIPSARDGYRGRYSNGRACP